MVERSASVLYAPSSPSLPVRASIGLCGGGAGGLGCVGGKV